MEITSCLLEHLQFAAINENPVHGLRVICLSRVIPCYQTLTCLCNIIASSCVSSLTTAAEKTAIEMLDGTLCCSWFTILAQGHCVELGISKQSDV